MRTPAHTYLYSSAIMLDGPHAYEHMHAAKYATQRTSRPIFAYLYHCA